MNIRSYLILIACIACLFAKPLPVEASVEQLEPIAENEKEEESDRKWSPTSYDSLKDSWWITAESHVSILNDVRDRSLFGDTFGYAVKVGYRWDRVGLFLQIEHNLWITQEFDRDVDPGALNLAIGLEVNYLGGYARSSIALGPSILLFDTVLDGVGATGYFLDLRPIGLRWPIADYFTINLDPLSFGVVAPVLEGTTLIMIEYRTTLGLEFVF